MSTLVIQSNNNITFKNINNENDKSYNKRLIENITINKKIKNRKIINNLEDINNIKKLIIIVPHLIENIIVKNIEMFNNKNPFISTLFDVEKSTDINLSFTNYFLRLIKHTNAESSSIIYALCLLDRICNNNIIKLTYNNVHKLFFTSLVISVKLLEDFTYSDSHYSKCGGVTNVELAMLETIFLKYINYDISVKDAFFNVYRNYLL